jgi:hypothetical protein
MQRVILCSLVVLCVETCLSTSKIRAASPREELLRLVPADVGFCLVLENLRTHGQALAASPFWHHLKASPLGAHLLAAPEMRKLEFVEQFLQEHLQVSAAQLRDDILGDAVVLCYRPGPPGKPDQEQGLLLLRARDEKLLARLVEQIHAKQRESGELQSLEELSYQGRKFYRRVERSKAFTFYFVHGPVLGFSTQELILRQALEREGASAQGEAPLERALRLLGVDKPLAALWINPRAFDAGLAQKLAESKRAQTAALRAVQKYWQALDGIAISLALEKDVELSLAVRATLAKLSPAARQLARTADQPSVLWKCFPDHALVAAALRIDVGALVDFVKEFLHENAQPLPDADIEKTVGAVVGKDTVCELLAHIGPDLGLVVLPPTAGNPSWVPQGLVAVRVQGDQQADRPDLTITNLLNALSIMAVYNLNGGRPGAYQLKSTAAKEAEIKYLVNDQLFPVGFRPAFALKRGYLLLGTSPEAIERFAPAADVHDSAPAARELPLLRVSFGAWQDFLGGRKAELARFLAEKHHLPGTEAQERLTKFQTSLQLLSALEVSFTSEPERAALTLRLRLVRPLK